MTLFYAKGLASDCWRLLAWPTVVTNTSGGWRTSWHASVPRGLYFLYIQWLDWINLPFEFCFLRNWTCLYFQLACTHLPRSSPSLDTKRLHENDRWIKFIYICDYLVAVFSNTYYCLCFFLCELLTGLSWFRRRSWTFWPREARGVREFRAAERASSQHQVRGPRSDAQAAAASGFSQHLLQFV